MLKRLTHDQLRETCDKSVLSFKSTKDLTPPADIIGQERAVRAMEFGLKIDLKGYNIFMTGLTGTGKTSYARAAVAKAAQGRPIPDDIIYVYNFLKPERPIAINLPAGKGSEFAKDMEKLIYDIRSEISRAFSDDSFEEQRQEIIERYQKQSMEIIANLDEIAKAEGFALQKTVQGIIAIPLSLSDSNPKPMSQEEYETLTSEQKKELEEKGRNLQNKIDEAIRKMRALDKSARREMDELEKDTALAAINPLFEEMNAAYKDNAKIIDYLKAVKNDLIANLMIVKEDRKEKQDGDEIVPLYGATGASEFFLRYRINLFVDNKATAHAPVIFETNPTYYNLFGKIEGRARLGTVVTDFMLIKSGAIHKANGGYLIIQAADLFKEPFAWDALKRTLNNGESQIENIGQEYLLFPTVTLKPEAIPIDVKIILIGNPYIYSLLNVYDEDFKKLFKVKVDFDVEMERNPQNIKKYAELISEIVKTRDLLHFDTNGVAEIIDYSSRLAEDKTKLSTRFNEILEVLYESSTWAELDGSSLVTKEHVEKAISEKIYRSNRIEERLLSMIEKEEILVDTEGFATGQINGLSVIDTVDYIFGQPSRITARVYLGNAGVVNIEREAKMSGRIHNKAVMILTGYLGEKYARSIPLSISASLTFEQNYGGIEGDSASCAELMALLSAIASVPVRQDIAVTGSLDQHGKIQPVGGTTYKIEGFYHACKLKGFTGTQGVVIPCQNITNLMLKPEVIAAAQEDKFHIYTAETIDDVIEIMTGMQAEEFHNKVKESLKKMAETAKKFYDK
ncbi:Lon protease family protein [Tepidanaerobacter sp. EBM-38]|jgi:lon-related putative ATP-dependent protease|uniref:Lon protease family protein n=1 Tax=Tepidanaerobacter sp. EBM-38 TaxID=1918496 RepID=UPI000AF7072F|nr:ATP-binding protein [Tepidanaerobacter sp. EBM-38]